MPNRWRKRWLIVLSAIAGILIATGIAVWTLNPRLTRYVESEDFRHEMEKETAKGLHFPGGQFAPIRRTGFLTAASDGFHATNGRKAIVSLDAHGLTVSFNPFGVFLRRWQMDSVHIGAGEVVIQTYDPKPEPSPEKPWFFVFLPDRVYLARVCSEPGDVTWRFRGRKSGFFGTRLLITPHGRDFEYQATGGTMKMTLLPDLFLRHTHLLITKTLLTLYTFDLAAGKKGDGSIHGEGTAGTREDKSVDFKIEFEKLPIAEWLPATWKGHFSGAATGKAHWTGKNPKLEGSSVQGTLQLHDGRVDDLPFLEKLASITGKKSIGHLELNRCALDLDWNYPNAKIRNMIIEDDGKFRIEGSVTVHDRSLGGTIQLGLAREYLEWLPHAEEVFPRQHGRYLWTAVHLSGTVDNPQQDLSPRIIEALKESPGAFLGLVLRQFGEWLQNVFRD